MSNKNKNNFQGRDCLSRMNFLFQASMMMAGRNQVLSAYYANLCKNIGKKSVLRMDPELKRSLCKKCSLAQRPGISSDLFAVTGVVTSSYRNDSDLNTHLHVQCRKCGYKRKFKINKNHKCWLENPESIAEVITCKTNDNELSLQGLQVETDNGMEVK